MTTPVCDFVKKKHEILRATLINCIGYDLTKLCNSTEFAFVYQENPNEDPDPNVLTVVYGQYDKQVAMTTFEAKFIMEESYQITKSTKWLPKFIKTTNLKDSFDHDSLTPLADALKPNAHFDLIHSYLEKTYHLTKEEALSREIVKDGINRYIVASRVPGYQEIEISFELDETLLFYVKLPSQSYPRPHLLNSVIGPEQHIPTKVINSAQYTDEDLARLNALYLIDSVKRPARMKECAPFVHDESHPLCTVRVRKPWGTPRHYFYSVNICSETLGQFHYRELETDEMGHITLKKANSIQGIATTFSEPLLITNDIPDAVEVIQHLPECVSQCISEHLRDTHDTVVELNHEDGHEVYLTEALVILKQVSDSVRFAFTFKLKVNGDDTMQTIRIMA